MRVFRLRRLLFVAVAGFVALACGRAEAQAQIAQPTPLCLRWTDTCSICERLRDSGAIQCSLSWSGQRAGCVSREVRCTRAEDPPAQTQIAQPTSWCLQWTDTCTTCERRGERGEIKCTLPRRGQLPDCAPLAVRCVMADPEACQRVKVIREPCNACSGPPDRPRMCTLKLCPLKEIVCVKPRA